MARPPTRSTLFPSRRSSDLASGAVLVGLEPAAGQPFTPLIRLDGAVWYDSTTFHAEAQATALVGNVSAPLFRGTFDISAGQARSEEHTSELQSHVNLVCRLL